jgi:hypothetical protein
MSLTVFGGFRGSLHPPSCRSLGIDNNRDAAREVVFVIGVDEHAFVSSTTQHLEQMLAKGMND